jgi:hypothetical protein
MSKINDSELMRWFKALLINKTDAQDRVYAWQKTPSTDQQVPLINITMDNDVLNRADEAGRGVDDSDRRIAIILLVKGVEESDSNTGELWYIEALDILENQARAKLDYDYVPPVPANLTKRGIKTVSIVSRSTEIHNRNDDYAARYLIYSVKIAEKRNSLPK